MYLLFRKQKQAKREANSSLCFCRISCELPLPAIQRPCHLDNRCAIIFMKNYKSLSRIYTNFNSYQMIHFNYLFEDPFSASVAISSSTLPLCDAFHNILLKPLSMSSLICSMPKILPL